MLAVWGRLQLRTLQTFNLDLPCSPGYLFFVSCPYRFSTAHFVIVVLHITNKTACAAAGQVHIFGFGNADACSRARYDQFFRVDYADLVVDPLSSTARIAASGADAARGAGRARAGGVDATRTLRSIRSLRWRTG